MKKVYRYPWIVGMAVLALFGLVMTACGDNSEPTPTVSGIEVSAYPSPEAMRGDSKYFVAIVEGDNLSEADKAVSWSIDGTVAEGTSIDDDGKLTVAAAETRTEIEVNATSDFDTSKSGTATVNIIDYKAPLEPGKPARLPAEWKEYDYNKWSAWFTDSHMKYASVKEKDEIYAFFKIQTNFDKLSKEGQDFWLPFVALT